jgi:hypothetical protein
MNAARLNRIAEAMLTPEFVVRVHTAKCKMEQSLRGRGDYDTADLARDLEIPMPVAGLLMNFVCALLAEGQMADALARSQVNPSEAQH